MLPLLQGDLSPLLLAHLVCPLKHLAQNSHAKLRASFHVCGVVKRAVAIKIQRPRFSLVFAAVWLGDLRQVPYPV